MSNQVATGYTLRDVCLVILRHRKKALSFFVAVVTGVVLLTLVWPKEYRSEGKLFVRLGRENATLDPTATLGQNPIVAVPLSRENEINSVVEIMQSRALLEKVVDKLGPAAILSLPNQAYSAEAVASNENTPEWIGRTRVEMGQIFALGTNLLISLNSSAGLDDRERAVLRLAKKVKVEAAKKSNVIEVSCEGPTPAQCQSVVAKLIDAYLDEHLRLNRAHGSHEFFADQTRRLRDNLSRREADLRDLKNRTGLASPAPQRQLIVARIGRLEDDILQAEAARAVAQARVQNLREKLASLPDTQVTAETSGFGDEGTDRMREQFYILQVREKEAQAKYTDDHPKMKQIREQIAHSRVRSR